MFLSGVCGGGLVGAGDLLRNVKGWGGEFRGGGSFFEGGGFFFGGGDGCAVFFAAGAAFWRGWLVLRLMLRDISTLGV